MYYRFTGRQRREVDKDLFETVEEVFDSSTVLAVLELVRRKIIWDLKGVVSAGKESRVYWGKAPDGSDLAIKIYLTSSAEFRKGMIKYLMGDPRFQRIPKSTRKLVITWARKEYRNLVAMYDVGASVPRPIAQYENILVMEFIGENGVRAPLLREVNLDTYEAEIVFYNVIEDVRKIYKFAGLVHGDLSEYNIMLHRNKAYIIDVSQAVKITHPNSHELLLRDLNNLIRYFTTLGVRTPTLNELLKYITDEGNDREE